MLEILFATAGEIAGIFVACYIIYRIVKYIRRKTKKEEVIIKTGMQYWDDWKEIEQLPDWVKKSERKSHHSHYKGKNYIYRIGDDGKFYMRKR